MSEDNSIDYFAEAFNRHEDGMKNKIIELEKINQELQAENEKLKGERFGHDCVENTKTGHLCCYSENARLRRFIKRYLTGEQTHIMEEIRRYALTALGGK